MLQAVANIECRYLGISHELNVVAKDMEQDTILGSYSDRTHTISVSVKSLMYDNPYELVDTICHEAYQHCLVDMYNTCDEQYRDLKLYRRVKKLVRRIFAVIMSRHVKKMRVNMLHQQLKTTTIRLTNT